MITLTINISELKCGAVAVAIDGTATLCTPAEKDRADSLFAYVHSLAKGPNPMKFEGDDAFEKMRALGMVKEQNSNS